MNISLVQIPKLNRHQKKLLGDFVVAVLIVIRLEPRDLVQT